jgi:hypothetical protein
MAKLFYFKKNVSKKADLGFFKSLNGNPVRSKVCSFSFLRRAKFKGWQQGRSWAAQLLMADAA